MWLSSHFGENCAEPQQRTGTVPKGENKEKDTLTTRTGFELQDRFSDWDPSGLEQSRHRQLQRKNIFSFVLLTRSDLVKSGRTEQTKIDWGIVFGCVWRNTSWGD